MDYRHDAFAIFDKPDILRYKRFKILAHHNYRPGVEQRIKPADRKKCVYACSNL